MLNFQLSQRPNEEDDFLPIENPVLDQIDILNEFDNFDEKLNSFDIISHRNNFLNNDNNDILGVIYEVDSEKRTINDDINSKSKASQNFNTSKSSFSNIALKEENSLSQLSEFSLIF